MAAVALASTEAPFLRRFELPDLARHGGWLMDRLLKAYPHLTQRELQGWLRGLIYNNEFLFLYQDHSVACAQVVRPTLSPKPVIQERFVFVETRGSAPHIDEASYFYEHMLRWAKAQGADTITVGELTDVPVEKIRDRIGRVYERKQLFARVGRENE